MLNISSRSPFHSAFLPATCGSPVYCTFSPILGMISLFNLSHSCAELFYKHKQENERHDSKKCARLYWTVELISVLIFPFCLTENRCTSYWRILRVDIRYLKELRVWLHPFLSVSGLSGTVMKRYFLPHFFSGYFGKDQALIFQDKRNAGSSGGSSTLCTQ